MKKFAAYRNNNFFLTEEFFALTDQQMFVGAFGWFFEFRTKQFIRMRYKQTEYFDGMNGNIRMTYDRSTKLLYACYFQDKTAVLHDRYLDLFPVYDVGNTLKDIATNHKNHIEVCRSINNALNECLC